MKLRPRASASAEAGAAVAASNFPDSRRRTSLALAFPAKVSRPGPRGGVQKRRVSARRSVLSVRVGHVQQDDDPKQRPPPASAPTLGRRARTRTPRPAPAPAPVSATPRTRTKKQMQHEVEASERQLEEDRPKRIDDLPEEIMLGIFSYFRPPQLCWKIGRVCKQWATWSVSTLLWKNKDYILSPDPKLGSKQKRV